MRITEIVTDDSMRELRLHGTSEFPFEYYDDDIRAYDRHYIAYHWHSEFEWCVIDHGRADCLIGAKRIALYEGDGIFINSKAIHSFVSEGGALMPNILFSPNLIAADTSAVYSEYVLPVLCAGSAYVVLRKEKEEDILQRLRAVFSLAREKTISKIEIQIAVCTLWCDFIKKTGGCWNGRQDAQGMLLQSRMRTMIGYIRENYPEKLTLAEIACSANISKSEALRCFREAIGTTPVKYLIDYRLDRARALLLSTNDTVTQIALQTGFDSVSYFVRIFRKEFGMTPRVFRLQNKKGAYAADSCDKSRTRDQDQGGASWKTIRSTQ